MTTTELKQIFQNPYNRTTWHTILRVVFPGVTILAQPSAIICAHKDVDSFLQLGSLRLRPLRPDRGGNYAGGGEGVNKTTSKKSQLFNSILPTLKNQSAYFSLNAVKQALTDADIELADDSLREYMSEAMASGIVADSGRGWYSRHKKPVNLDPKPVSKIIRDVKKAFPLLDFCCWSTVQFNPFAQHLIAQPTIFLYAESDALETVAETLKKNGWYAWANPGKINAQRYVQPGEKTVILRPSTSKQPESTNHAASIEKALVDLSVESHKLQIIAGPEVQRIIDTVLGAGLIQLSVLFGYSEIKRETIESEEATH
jgi:uncharacterized protein DUF6577